MPGGTSSGMRWTKAPVLVTGLSWDAWSSASAGVSGALGGAPSRGDAVRELAAPPPPPEPPPQPASATWTASRQASPWAAGPGRRRRRRRARGRRRRGETRGDRALIPGLTGSARCAAQTFLLAPEIGGAGAGGGGALRLRRAGGGGPLGGPRQGGPGAGGLAGAGLQLAEIEVELGVARVIRAQGGGGQGDGALLGRDGAGQVAGGGHRARDRGHAAQRHRAVCAEPLLVDGEALAGGGDRLGRAPGAPLKPREQEADVGVGDPLL